ncbi:MAG: hypothetical protein ACLR2E_02785 [Lachnospiraceae bacterium]
MAPENDLVPFEFRQSKLLAIDLISLVRIEMIRKTARKKIVARKDKGAWKMFDTIKLIGEVLPVGRIIFLQRNYGWKYQLYL